MMCDKLGLDAWEVIDAAATKPYGFMKFTPDPGVGGHCIPLDPQSLSWKLRTLNYNARFVQLAQEINRCLPTYWINKVADVLNSKKKTLNGSRILVLGATYKPDIDDLRESPALDIIKLLDQHGAQVTFNDPYIRSLQAEGLTAPFADFSESVVLDSDCVMIVTNHSVYDWSLIHTSSPAIVDCRNTIK
jgi:UDP-N-acetyl-D-glucosamine dehydrogenase